jgi:hypothetical protein
MVRIHDPLEWIDLVDERRERSRFRDGGESLQVLQSRG